MSDENKTMKIQLALEQHRDWVDKIVCDGYKAPELKIELIIEHMQETIVKYNKLMEG